MKVKEIQEKIVKEMIDGLKNKTLIWDMPCFKDMPRNLDGKHYRGFNYLYCVYQMEKMNYKNNIWGTFNAIKAKKGSVNAGSKAIPIFFYSFINGTKENKKTGKTEDSKVPFLRYYNIFNIEQTNLNIKDFVKENKIDFIPIEQAEKVLHQKNPVIKISADGNYYRPSEDSIGLQAKETFKTIPAYYETAFHELTHWTGHESRLKRELAGLFSGVKNYSFEELIAEIGSSFVMAELGLQYDKENTQAYINGWIEYLSSNPEQLIKASSQAQKAVRFYNG